MRSLSFFERIKIFALEIFDQRQLKHGAIVRLTDDHRHFAQTQKLRRAPASFTGDEFEMLALFADNQRLNNASLLARAMFRPENPCAAATDTDEPSSTERGARGRRATRPVSVQLGLFQQKLWAQQVRPALVWK